MRSSPLLFVFALAGCELFQGDVASVPVYWMEWAAEAPATRGFGVEVVVHVPCMLNPKFGPGVSAEPGRVTVKPFFSGHREDVYCVDGDAFVSFLDTSVVVPGLLPGTYELWAPPGPVTNRIPDPIRFGDVAVVVEPDAIDTIRAAGTAQFQQSQSDPCVRMSRPAGPGLVLVGNPPSFTGSSVEGFVRGFYTSTPPTTCGGVWVFHVEGFTPAGGTSP